MKRKVLLGLICFFLFMASIFGVGAENEKDIITYNPVDSFSVTEKDFSTGKESVKTFDNLSHSQIFDVLPITSTNNTSSSPRMIVGDDDRVQIEDTTMYPYSAIVLLEIDWPGIFTDTYATAFMVSEKVAITSAHCLYNKERGGWANSVRAFPAKNGYGIWNNPYGSSLAASIGVCTQWREHIDSSDSETPSYPEEDWGAVILLESLGKETGTIEMKIPTAEDLYKLREEEQIKTVGYPGDLHLYPFYQYQSTGFLSIFNADMLYYNLDTESGHGGAPILTEDNVAIGIHFGIDPLTRTRNCAVRIDENMMYYFNQAIQENG